MTANALTVPEGFSLLVQVVDRTLGIDLAPYASRQLFRRLESFRLHHGAADLKDLARRLDGDVALQQAFSTFLTINVTEFFRNPQQWATLRRLVPSLAKPAGGVQAWSAGCSIGAEPYSLAMLLQATLPGRPHRVLATDIDAEVLAHARTGRYTGEQISGVPEDLKRVYLRLDGDDYLVSDTLRNMVAFRRHDLLRDPPPGRFDLVLCRNVTIYFNDAGRDRAYRCLSQGLVGGGLLFIGATESLLNPSDYGLHPVEPGFYRKLRA